MHTSRRITTPRPLQRGHYAHILYDLLTIGPSNDHSDLAQNTIPGQRSCHLIGQESNRRHPIQKHQTTWIDHVIGRNASWVLFVSILSNITDCPLVPWPRQQDIIDSSAVDTQKHQVIHLHRDDPPTILITLSRVFWIKPQVNQWNKNGVNSI